MIYILILQVHSICSTHLIYNYSHVDINGNTKILICDINSINDITINNGIKTLLKVNHKISCLSLSC